MLKRILIADDRKSSRENLVDWINLYSEDSGIPIDITEVDDGIPFVEKVLN